MQATRNHASPEWMRTLRRVFNEPAIFTLNSPAGMWLVGRDALSVFATENSPKGFDVSIGDSFALEIRADFGGRPLPRNHPMRIAPSGDDANWNLASGRTLNVPERQIGPYVLGTIFHQGIPEPHGRPPPSPDVLARFVVDLPRGTHYIVATNRHNPFLTPGVVVCTKVSQDLHGGNAVHTLLVCTDGTIIGRCVVKALCVFCEARGSNTCDCSDGFRERVRVEAPKMANWGELVRHGRESWMDRRGGTMHDVADDDAAVTPRASQKTGFLFYGRELEELRQRFVDKCWALNASSLGADRLLFPDLISSATTSMQKSRDRPPVGEREPNDFEHDHFRPESSLHNAPPTTLGHGRKKPQSTSKYRHKCSDCGALATSPFNLRRHQAALHQKLREFECDECGYAFTQKQNLDRHKHNVHLRKASFQCDSCPAQFSTASNLRRHIGRFHAEGVTSVREAG